MSILLYFTIVPLGTAFLVTLLRKKKGISDLLAVLSSLYLFGLSLATAGLTKSHGVMIYKVGGWFPTIGITLVVDGLSAFLLVAINLVAFLVLIYAISYMERYTDKWKFHALFMFMLAGLNGVIISGDLFNLYVFLEIASISAYALVAFGVKPQNLEAAFKYTIMGAVASIFILLGIALLYSYTSTLNMADVAYCLSDKAKNPLLVFIWVLFLAGFGLKAALVPFHAWLPDAHSSAPSPVSAMLSGVVIKTIGIYALMRIFFNVLGVSINLLSVLMASGILSMVVGAFLAIAQNDIKRMLAYSSISQVGYIIFALGVGTPLAILGGLFHLFNHAVFKSLLFLDAGAIEYSTGERNMDKLGGLNNKLPVTGYTSLMAAMSISGIPPLAGFWSKLIIIVAAVEAGYIGYAIVAVLISIVTLVYYLKFQSFVFFGKLDAVYNKIQEVPLAMKTALVILAVICVMGGLMLTGTFRPFLEGASNVILSGTGYKQAVLGAIR
ncbi:MAG: monovalent cation/H+ antiporter subunit D family protein [Candidatus Omnitrophica bacterium]|nr:monovalent cation/H+ antiporter subunit D family protein [Candidatus Omnitrophota bacterium]